jgi:peptidoglycan L-alanyl-D-glutamate endopeptidase CwlK
LRRMRDQKSASKIKVLHPKAVPIFTKFIEDSEEALDITLRITYGLRTFDEQQAIYDQGRTTPGKIVSYAPPGFSFHNYGLAIDIAELKDGKLNWNFDYGRIRTFSDALNIKWGGTFKKLLDKPHFELSFGYTIRELYAKWLAKDFITGTKYINL